MRYIPRNSCLLEKKVLSVIKSQEAWMRQGKSIRQGEFPVIQQDYTPKVKKEQMNWAKKL